MHSDINILSDEQSVSLVVSGIRPLDVQSVFDRLEQLKSILDNVVECDALVEQLSQEDFENRAIDWVSADLKYQAALSEALSRSEFCLSVLRGDIPPGHTKAPEVFDET